MIKRFILTKTTSFCFGSVNRLKGCSVTEPTFRTKFFTDYRIKISRYSSRLSMTVWFSSVGDSRIICPLLIIFAVYVLVSSSASCGKSYTFHFTASYLSY
jgi:hypothetical protein